MIVHALLTLALLAPSRAQDSGGSDMSGQQATTDTTQSETELYKSVADQIRSNPNVAPSLAQRIARSSVASSISSSNDVNEIAQWIRQDPEAAAVLAVGFARDDASGGHLFEDSLRNQNQRRKLEFNPSSRKGLMGKLNKSSRDSKLMRQDDQMSDEEQREILKTMFEGQGSQSNKIVTQEEKGGPPDQNKTGANVPSNYFDRLSKGNLRGYSPQLQALQSALNARRAPGAPKLIETGRLDYETLSYPGYGMRWDIGTLDARLRLERAWALAKALGLEGRNEQAQLADPAVQAELEKQAAAKGVKLSARYDRRRAAIARAAAALQDFDGAALPAKDPLKISRSLILGLGSRQKEAARWITAASLEEELERLETEQDFLSAELVEMIKRCPVGEGDKASYLRRGEDYKASLAKMKANDEAAVAKLESDAWQSELDAVQAALDENANLRRNLSRNIADFRAVPYHLLSLESPKPHWRELIDQYVVQFLPSLAYSRQLRAVQARRDKLKDVFIKIAMGDLDAAHTILSAELPNAAPVSRR